jgi:hypothetical protein
MKTKWILSGLFIATASIFTLGVALVVPRLSSRSGRQPMPTNFRSGLPAPGGDAIYAYDFDDNRILMGNTHYVFVGQILEQIGSEPVANQFAATQFMAEVIVNIKGTLAGKVIVNQYENDDRVLQKGATYLDLPPIFSPRIMRLSPGCGSPTQHS